jgi:hypothetical protein
VLNANGNLLVTRLPYGSGDGSGYSTKYSALVYPYIPVDVVNPCTTYASYLTGATVSVGLYDLTVDDMSPVVTTDAISIINTLSTANAMCVSGVASQEFTFTGTFYDSYEDTYVGATMVFNTNGSIISAGSTHPELSGYQALSSMSFTGLFTEAALTSSHIYIDESKERSNMRQLKRKRT